MGGPLDMPCYKQSEVYEALVGRPMANAHNALGVVRGLVVDISQEVMRSLCSIRQWRECPSEIKWLYDSDTLMGRITFTRREKETCIGAPRGCHG